jgi:mannose-6-phosphate isomerase-like protein (cupin superfamily)
MRPIRARIAGVAAFAALLCLLTAPVRADPPAVLDALFPDGRRTLRLEELAGRVALEPGEDVHLIEIGRDRGSSHHVVAIRDREVPHRHDRHDLVVVMVRGHGSMLLGDEERPVGVGSILYVPRGTVHAFRNAADEPAVAYAVYAPAFDGKDRVIVGAGVGAQR